MWTVEETEDPETGQVWLDEDDIAKALVDCVPMLTRLGGRVVVVADRYPTNHPDLYVTRRIVFQYESFVPAARPEPVAEVEEEPEAEPELEPVLTD